MIHDVADQPGALPLLQYALTELFECKDGRVLTLEAYHEIGGISGALARRADDIYDGLDEVGQAATRQLFLRLVTLGEGNEDTRRRVKLSELESLSINRDADSARESEKMAHELPIAEYGRYRLLTFDHDPLTREPTVEVAHEALLREWARLRLWLEESRDDIRRQRLLATAAAQWADAGAEASYLLRGNRLAEFAAWAETTPGQPGPVALTAQERRFLAASIAARDRRLSEEQARQQRELETARQLAEIERKRAEEQTRTAQRLRQRALFLVGALVMAALLAVIAVVNGNRAVQNAGEARDNLALAVSREAEAVANANAAATQETLANENANLAGTREAEAQSNASAAATSQAEAVAQEAVASGQQATAEAEAAQRAVAQAKAEREARIAFSRELAAAALNNLQVDPERSVLLALEAIHTAETVEARNALHAALPALQLLDVLSADEQRLFEIAANEDGTLVAEAMPEDDDVRIWDVRSGQIVKEIADEEVKFGHMAFIPGTNLLAVSNSQFVMQIWDLNSDTVVQTIDVSHSPAVYEPAFSPNGTQLATWGPEDKEVVIWDVTSGESGIL